MRYASEFQFHGAKGSQKKKHNTPKSACRPSSPLQLLGHWPICRPSSTADPDVLLAGEVKPVVVITNNLYVPNQI